MTDTNTPYKYTKLVASQHIVVNNLRQTTYMQQTQPKQTLRHIKTQLNCSNFSGWALVEQAMQSTPSPLTPTQNIWALKLTKALIVKIYIDHYRYP